MTFLSCRFPLYFPLDNNMRIIQLSFVNGWRSRLFKKRSTLFDSGCISSFRGSHCAFAFHCITCCIHPDLYYSANYPPATYIGHVLVVGRSHAYHIFHSLLFFIYSSIHDSIYSSDASSNMYITRSASFIITAMCFLEAAD